MSSAGGIKTDESQETQGLASLSLSERHNHIMQGVAVPDKIVSTKPPKRKKRVSDEMSQYINPVKYLSSSSYMDQLLRGNSHRYMRESSLDYGAYGSYGSHRDYDYYEPRYRPRSPSPPRIASSSKITLEILRERERKKHSWEKSSKSEHKSKKKKEKNKSRERKSMENISSSSPKKEHRSSEDHDAKRSRLEGEFSESSSPNVPLSEKAKGKQKEVYNEREEDTKQKTKTVETGLTGSSTGTGTSGFIDGDYVIGDVDDVELHMAILASMQDAQPTKVSDDDDVLMKMLADVDKKEPPTLPELDDFEDISSGSDSSLPPIFEGEHAKIYADILEMDKKQKERDKRKRKQKEKEKEKGKGKKISPAEMLEIARAEEREAYRQLKEVEKRAELQRLELERIMGKDWIYRNDYYY